jgi:hypothetical protein
MSRRGNACIEDVDALVVMMGEGWEGGKNKKTNPSSDLLLFPHQYFFHPSLGFRSSRYVAVENFFSAFQATHIRQPNKKTCRANAKSQKSPRR